MDYTLLPKIELHLHVEGAIPKETLIFLHDKYEKEPLTQEKLEEKLKYTDFLEFLGAFRWGVSYIRTYEDVDRLVYDVLKSLAAQGIFYIEAFLSPGHYEVKNGLSVPKVVETALSASKKAFEEFNIECKFIIDLIRQEGPENGTRWLRDVKQYLGKGVIGIGLGGDEKNYPPPMFTEVYREAKEAGFQLTIHAGEADGVDSIQGALDLGVSRIGHGIRCVEDPNMVQKLIENQLCLEMCPSSNVATKVINSIEEHPIRDLFEKGLNICVNSDDPTFFHSTISNEFKILHEKLGFSIQDLKKLTLNALNSSWIDDEKKAVFKEKIEKGYLQFEE